MKIIEKIKEWLGFTDYCPKHKVKYIYQGWENRRRCLECRKKTN